MIVGERVGVCDFTDLCSKVLSNILNRSELLVSDSQNMLVSVIKYFGRISICTDIKRVDSFNLE